MGLEERSLSLGGEFLAKSKPGAGTTVTARFPFEEPCAKDEEDG
jgi:signal transduction histidine kinase